MSYNQKYYPKDLIRNQEHLNLILDIQENTLFYLIDFLVDTNDVGQINHCNSFIHLVAKIRFNVESVSCLISQFMFDDFRFKLSVNLLYRSIVDDIINIRYLISVFVRNEKDMQSLNNELNILHKEFLIGVITGVKAEKEFHKYIAEIQEREYVDDFPNAVQNIKDENSELIDSVNGKWLSSASIRSNTYPELLKLMEKDGKEYSFLSETKKLSFIKARGLSGSNELTFLFKYFSQYQHYSPKSDDLIKSNIESDLYFYFITLSEIIVSCDVLTQILNFKDVELIKAKSLALQNQISDVGIKISEIVN